MAKHVTKEDLMIKGLITEIIEWVNDNVCYCADPYDMQERLNEHLNEIEKELNK